LDNLQTLVATKGPRRLYIGLVFRCVSFSASSF
jgi:hypothetical protein